jgi:hypothetical protein
MEKNFIVIPVFDNPIYCEEAAGKKTRVLEDSLCNKSGLVARGQQGGKKESFFTHTKAF